MKIINESTLIPLSMAAVIISGSVFVTTLYADVQKLKEQQIIDRVQREKMADDIVSIKIQTEKILIRVSK